MLPRTLLQQAVAINPNDYDARYNLDFILLKLGKPAAAHEQPRKGVVQLNPESSEARFQLAAALRSLGQQDLTSDELKIVQQNKEQSVRADVAGAKADQANQYLQAGDAQEVVDLSCRCWHNGRSVYDHRHGSLRRGQSHPNVDSHRAVTNRGTGRTSRLSPATLFH
jgi:tetratricopeptide (TPR) repeat protein